MLPPHPVHHSDCARGGGTAAFTALERGRRGQQARHVAEAERRGRRPVGAAAAASASFLAGSAAAADTAAAAACHGPLCATCFAQAAADSETPRVTAIRR